MYNSLIYYPEERILKNISCGEDFYINKYKVKEGVDYQSLVKEYKANHYRHFYMHDFIVKLLKMEYIEKIN